MNKKIKFLATGDIHSDKKIMNNISNYTNFDEIDFVIFTGDLSENKNDFKKILSIFKNKQIIMTPGNHENKKQIKLLKEKYNISMIGDNPLKITKDLVIFGSNFLNVGKNGRSEQEIYDDLIKKIKSIENIENKILLSHIPPHNTKIGNASKFFPYIGGSLAISAILEDFDINLSLVGHIHESSGLEEVVFGNKVLNVAKTSKIIEFDTNKKKLNIIN